MTQQSDTIPADDAERWPGEPAFWSVICGDIIIFSAMFCLFMWDRLHNAATFNAASSQLHETTGLVFTVLMIVSSWFVAKALRYVRQDENARALRMIIYALICGAAFVIIKFIDYDSKISMGITPAKNVFFMYYYALTGMHLLHVIIAMGAMIPVMLKLRGKQLSSGDVTFSETVFIFWHLTDFLWVMIFALIYLIR